MKKSDNEFWLKKIFRSTWFFVGVLILLIVFSVSLISEMIRKMEIQKEISELEEQVDSLQSRNDELGTLIEYFQTDEFVTKEARTKLGFKNPGETVVALPEEALTGEGDGDVKNGELDKKNWQIWWEYFFNKNK